MLMKAVEKQGWRHVHEPIGLAQAAQRGPDVPLEAVGLRDGEGR